MFCKEVGFASIGGVREYKLMMVYLFNDVMCTYRLWLLEDGRSSNPPLNLTQLDPSLLNEKLSIANKKFMFFLKNEAPTLREVVIGFHPVRKDYFHFDKNLQEFSNIIYENMLYAIERQRRRRILINYMFS